MSPFLPVSIMSAVAILAALLAYCVTMLQNVRWLKLLSAITCCLLIVTVISFPIHLGLAITITAMAAALAYIGFKISFA